MLSSPIVLQMPPELRMTDEQFFEFCQINRDLRIERNKFGDISIMPPTGSETGNRDASPGIPEECLDAPASVSGDEVLPGFVLNMTKVW